MTNVSHRLREGITLYSAVLENPDAHMQLLADTADLIDDLTRQRDHLLAAAQVIVYATGICNMIDYPEIVIDALEACEEAIANVKVEVK